jgi:hypothetical protein
MVHVSLFQKLFEVDLRSLDEPAHWWFIDGVDHPLTNEEVLFNRQADLFSEPLAEAVETFWTSRVARCVGRRVPSSPGRSRARGGLPARGGADAAVEDVSNGPHIEGAAPGARS